MKQRNKLETNQGITLIALVITIIVLLILAAISIAMLTGENGILTQAKNAKENTTVAGEKEQLQLAYMEAKANKLETGKQEAITAEELQTQLDYDGVKATATQGTISNIEVTFDKTKNTYIINGETGEIIELVETPQVSENGEFSRANGTIDIQFLKGTSYEIGEANPPRIEKGTMVPVNWDDSTNKWKVTDEAGWVYSYGDTDTTKKWANIMLRDTLALEDMENSAVQTATIEDMKGKSVTQEGSMFVWIPRYAYKITYYEGDTVVGYSDARGLVDTEGKTPKGMNTPVTSVAAGDNYRPHPAFEDNSSTNSTRAYSQGEWRTKLTGIWMGKFETTQKVNDKITVRPNQASYGMQSKRNIGTFYTDAQNLGIANSHMIKNSEWGAMAYLTESKYGRNEIAVTKNSQLTTGDGAYQTNVNQSTTNNIYGVYDTVGGLNEYTTSYIADSQSSCANSFAAKEGSSTNDKEESTEFSTVYEKVESDIYTENYTANINKVFGDAMIEISTAGSGETSWHSASSGFVGLLNYYYPFFRRGGYYSLSNAGSFYFNSGNGSDINYGFRVCLAI